MELQAEIYPSKFEENLDKKSFSDPADYCQATCQGKVDEVIQRLEKEGKKWDLAIFGDCICTQNGEIIEKPQDEQDVFKMLKRFSGKTHQVITAVKVVVKTNEGKIIQDDILEKTLVEFCDIPDEAIKEYAKTQYPWGKSGGYGYQDVGAMFVKKIEGDAYNIIGLPIHAVTQSIIKLIKEAKWVQ
ncbi:hypothetical protein PPERSA_11281 [Pseudocohnilembus persalinus]|uniref:Maf-like protein n=1 Tax=Pseudocohnilembus persalinus TaxID=266149 RepID=A0A0V0QPQ8_PSEPJ|nr:hypothetical protein PPERSA_11281 [Pseudocohnilembus persalinus]|eukprot:KRX04157.1 hypothetical protein PPERSA_11281 [Pseudocohnilembus persalinus]